MGFAVNARKYGHTQTDKQYINICYFDYTRSFNYITLKKCKPMIFVRMISFISEGPNFHINFGMASTQSDERDSKFNFLTYIYIESFNITALTFK